MDFFGNRIFTCNNYNNSVIVTQEFYSFLLPVIALFCNGKLAGFKTDSSGSFYCWFCFSNEEGKDFFMTLIYGFDSMSNIYRS